MSVLHANSQTVGTSAVNQVGTGSGWVNLATLTAPRTGNAMAAGWAGGQRHNTNSGDFSNYARIRNVTTSAILFDGAANGWRTNCGGNDVGDPVVAMWQGTVNAGDVIAFDVETTQVAGGNSVDFSHGGSFYLTVG